MTHKPELENKMFGQHIQMFRISIQTPFSYVQILIQYEERCSHVKIRVEFSSQDFFYLPVQVSQLIIVLSSINFLCKLE